MRRPLNITVEVDIIGRGFIESPKRKTKKLVKPKPKPTPKYDDKFKPVVDGLCAIGLKRPEAKRIVIDAVNKGMYRSSLDNLLVDIIRNIKI